MTRDKPACHCRGSGCWCCNYRGTIEAQAAAPRDPGETPEPRLPHATGFYMSVAGALLFWATLAALGTWFL